MTTTIFCEQVGDGFSLFLCTTMRRHIIMSCHNKAQAKSINIGEMWGKKPH